MQTLTISRTGGRSNYTLSPTRNTGELQDKFAKCNGKSRKSAIRDPRTKPDFPKFEAGMSTADYVKMFEAWGNHCKPVEWEQLNEEPCTLYSGADTCETLPDGFDTWEDFDAAQSPETAPESTLAAANDDAAPTVPDPEPAAPGAIVAAEVDQVSAVNIDRAMIERFGVSDPAACSHIPGAAAEIARIEAAEIVAVFYRDFANCNDGAAPGVDAILQRARHLRGTAAGFADLPNPDRGAPYAEAARILESDAQSKPAAQSEPERIADVMRARVANTAEALREAAEEIEDRATRVPATRAAEYCAAAAMLRSDAEAAPAVRQSREAFDAATKAAAETLLRLTMGEAHDSARSALIERGRYGAIGARGAIVDELKRLSAAKHWHGWREAQKALYTLGAAESAPVAAPIETAPAEVAPPHYAIGDPLTTQSDARAPVDGERFRILERSRATYDNLWTCAEVSTARRAADVAQSIIAGWTGGERWAVCADSGAFLYGIGADGKPMSAAPVCAPADDEPAETGAAWFERIIAENKAKRDDCEARAQKVAPLDSVPFKHSDGERFGIAGPCMSEPGRFRFSYFDSRGTIGHCTRDTLALAMWEALDLGYLYATEDTAPVDPLPTQSDSVPVPGKSEPDPVPLPGELVTTFRALRVGVAFKFDSYGPVWVRARGGFRPGCGGQLHSCAPSVRVIRCSTQDARSDAEITAGARHTASLPSESDNAAPVAKPRVERERRADYLPDDDETIPAPLDGLDVAELNDLAEFERAGGEVKPTAPAYRDDAPRATPTPSLRISPSDPRARIPARFAPVYLLQA